MGSADLVVRVGKGSRPFPCEASPAVLVQPSVARLRPAVVQLLPSGTMGDGLTFPDCLRLHIPSWPTPCAPPHHICTAPERIPLNPVRPALALSPPPQDMGFSLFD